MNPARAIIDALGIDPAGVCAIDLRLRPEQPPVVTVLRFVDHETIGRVRTTLEQFEITERGK